jgi:AcrR family transcriptional regulator
MTAQSYTEVMAHRQEGEGGETRPTSTRREAQRRRTRAAIVAAARTLIAQGSTPSIDDVAATADVSRRTIYMYFPTLDQLLLDAALGLMSDATVNAVLDPDRYGDDVAARVDALARVFVDLGPETLPLGRKILSLTVDAPRPDDGVRRGYRRIEWIERAIEPLRTRLPPEQFERLVSALAVMIGWEAMIVLEDVRGLDPEAEADVMQWTARVLVEAALADAATADSPRARRSPPARRRRG